MKQNVESGFMAIIMLLGAVIFFGSGYLILSKTGFPKIAAPQFGPPEMFYQQEMPPEEAYTDIPPEYYSMTPLPTVSVPTQVIPTIPPFKLEPLTITLTDTQFTQFAKTYMPSDLPVTDLRFTFSDNTIEATTIATSQIVQGPIKVVAVVDNKWFRITKVYVGTFELPDDMTTQINTLVQDNFRVVIASLYLDGLQIESIKGNTIKLSLNAPKGSVQKQGSSYTLDQNVPY